MRFVRTVLLAVLGVGTMASVGCKVIDDTDSNREASSAAEDRVDVTTLPINVTAAIKGVMPTGVITDGRKETRRGKLVYNMNVTDGQKKYNVVVSPDGTILSSKQLGA